ncbi:MAG: response regulator transcription factor [Cyclobacteriaceae bacterium]|nr:response regulator transcription factor [Cyclobacteriaceae bacterium SS2]
MNLSPNHIGANGLSGSQKDTIRLLIADDHLVAREGIVYLLSGSPGVEVVGEANNGREAISMIENLKPDILVCDISMPDFSGIELLKKLEDSGQNVKVLILSMHKDPEYIMKSFEYGALGYLPKNADEGELIKAIETIHSGDRYLTQEVSNVLAQSMLASKSTVKYNLTSREKEIINNLVKGLSNKQIAAELFISIRTVDTHRTNIMKKLKVKNVASLVKLALNENLCD